MNRRSFLATLAAGLTLDPERLLWRPGAKLISIPKPKLKLAMHSFSCCYDFESLKDIPALLGRAARRSQDETMAKLFDASGTDRSRLGSYERTR